MHKTYLVLIVTASLLLWQFVLLGQTKPTPTVTAREGGYPVYVKGQFARSEGDTPGPGGVGAWIRIIDGEAGEELLIVPAQKKAYLRRVVAKSGDLYRTLRGVMENPTKPLGEQAFDGEKLVGFSGVMKNRGEDGIVSDVPVQVWLDPVTRLPRRLEYINTPTGKAYAGLEDIKFDQPLDDSLFAMKAPDGMQLVDSRKSAIQKLRPPPTTQEAERLILHPGVGIGDIKLGDPAAKIVAVLGEPEIKDDEPSVSLEYPSLGLRFSLDNVNQDPPGLAAIFADDGDMPSLCRAFVGATVQGIRLGMSRKQVEQTYGKPSRENTQNADYRKLGLAVIYRPDGIRVSGFVIVKPSDQPIFGGETTQPTTRP